MKKLVLLMAAVMTMGFVACTDNGGKKVEEASAAQTEEVSAAQTEEETSMAAEETSAAQESSAVKATTDKTEEVKSEASAPAEKK